ncbi:MAG: carbohydrate ABC transporter permease [Chloroflexota bacterium]|nr:carbohydrate ABC transporter permease [Chloroflexota bacterium]
MANMALQDTRLEDARAVRTGLARWLPKRWYAHLILIVACFIVGFPLFYSIIVSTQTSSDVYAYRFTPGEALGDNWDKVMNLAQLWRYMLNSLLVTVAVTAGKVVLSLLAGLAFVYFRFPGKWLVFGFVLLTLMMPTEILILALFRFINQIGLGNTTGALIIPFIASATGAFLFRQHFANIPAELSEAAQLDGATPIQFLLQVLIPISWNTIGALTVIQFIYAWNMYLWPALIIQGQANQVVQVGLRTLVGADQAISFGPLMLAAVVASLPPLAVFLALQKQFMSGFALSRDK